MSVPGPVRTAIATAPRWTAIQPATRTPLHNDILDAVPEDEWPSLRGGLAQGLVARGTVMQRQGRAGAYLYFPAGGLCSVLAHADNGHAVEVALIGREGVVGMESLGRGQAAVCDVVVQVSAPRWYRLAASAIDREHCPELMAMLAGYGRTLVAMACQTAACNTFHPVDRRLARWLLMAVDRVGSDEFAMTQDRLALMLGVRRATVTLAVGALQRIGAITYRKGARCASTAVRRGSRRRAAAMRRSPALAATTADATLCATSVRYRTDRTSVRGVRSFSLARGAHDHGWIRTAGGAD